MVAAIFLWATVVTGGAQASPLASGTGWKVEPTPNSNTAATGINELSGVACLSAGACTAVGSHAASLSSPSFALAERWQGSKWRIQRTVLPAGAASATLTAVACPSTTSCTAVGSAFVKATNRTVNLVETWDGAGWQVPAVPTPSGSTGSSLFGVSCVTPGNCTAVGHYSTAAGQVRAEVERWNGGSWSLQTPARPTGSSQLSGVSCPTAQACLAVGYYGTGGDAHPFADVWRAGSWHLQAVPLPSGSPGGILAAVSCTSGRECTATGANFTTTAPTLAERWDGSRWRIEATPTPANVGTTHEQPELNAVSCRSASGCTAVGAYAPGGHPAYFLEGWNGQRWRLERAVHPAGFVEGALNGVSCARLAGCTAVGAWSGGRISVETLALAR